MNHAITAERQAVGILSPVARGWIDRVNTRSLILWAFLGSRCLVLSAGVAGALLVPRRVGWQIHDSIGYSTHFGSLGNLLASSAVRWDSGHYLAIASHGYAATVGRSPVFYPLYPLLIHALGYLTGSDASAGVMISLASFGLALVLLHRLTELELGRPAADATVLLLAFAPLSFFFSAVYTESLFLLLSVGSIYAARRERWMLAGALGGLAAITRTTGILLVLPIVIMQLRSRRTRGRQLGWTLLVPGALVGYLAFLAANGISWLAPFREEALWGRQTVGPVLGLAAALFHAIRGAATILRGAQPIYHPTLLGPLTPSAEQVWLLLVLAIAGMLLVCCFRRLPLQYGAYAAAALLMCLSSPEIGGPLQSFDRYVLTIFPLWMAAGAWVAKRRLQPAAVLVGGGLLVFYTVWFSSWAFIA